MAIIRMAGAVALLTVGALYPYLPGRHDPLAVAVAHIAQTVAALAVLLVPIGGIWLAVLARGTSDQARVVGRRCGLAALAAVALIAAIAAVVALASSGVLLALTTAACASYVLAHLAPRLVRPLADETLPHDAIAPLGLVGVPLLALLLQIAPAGAMTDASRGWAMTNAAELIDELERHRASHGRYPSSLEAVSPDYEAGVVGIAQYHYTAHGDAYTLHFEQPLPVFVDLGTREFVAYAPAGEHLVLSHAVWHVSRAPESLAAGQGWYDVRDTDQRGWKRFRFD